MPVLPGIDPGKGKGQRIQRGHGCRGSLPRERPPSYTKKKHLTRVTHAALACFTAATLTPHLFHLSTLFWRPTTHRNCCLSNRRRNPLFVPSTPAANDVVVRWKKKRGGPSKGHATRSSSLCKFYPWLPKHRLPLFLSPQQLCCSIHHPNPREKQTLPVFVPAAAADGTWRLMLPVKRLENEALMIHVLKSNVLRISTLPACEH